MSDPEAPEEPADPPRQPVRSEPFLFRLARTAIAPPVLSDGGHDAPLTARGRILFWGAVGLLVAGIVTVLVLTVAK